MISPALLLSLRSLRLAVSATGLVLVIGSILMPASVRAEVDRTFGHDGDTRLVHEAAYLIPDNVATLDNGSLLITGSAIVDDPNEECTPGADDFCFDMAFPAATTRLLPDGRIDQSYGTKGSIIEPVTNTRGISRSFATADGSILIVGQAGSDQKPRLEIRHRDASGNLVVAWGTGGVTKIAVPEAVDRDVESGGPNIDSIVLAQRPSGRGYYLAWRANYGDRGRVIVVALDASGRLDPSFAQGGRLRIGAGDQVDLVSAHNADATYIVATSLSRNRSDNLRSSVRIRRLAADGTTQNIGAPFNIGSCRTNAAATATPRGLVLALECEQGPAAQLIGLTPDGTLDPSFGNAGRRFLGASLRGTSESSLQISVDRFDRIVLAYMRLSQHHKSGTDSDTEVAVSRLDASGQFDQSFAGTGSMALDLAPGSLADQFPEAIGTDSAGSVILVGVVAANGPRASVGRTVRRIHQGDTNPTPSMVHGSIRSCIAARCAARTLQPIEYLGSATTPAGTPIAGADVQVAVELQSGRRWHQIADLTSSTRPDGTFTVTWKPTIQAGRIRLRPVVRATAGALEGTATRARIDLGPDWAARMSPNVYAAQARVEAALSESTLCSEGPLARCLMFAPYALRQRATRKVPPPAGMVAIVPLGNGMDVRVVSLARSVRESLGLQAIDGYPPVRTCTGSGRARRVFCPKGRWHLPWSIPSVPDDRAYGDFGPLPRQSK